MDKPNECIFWLKIMTYQKELIEINLLEINKEFDSKPVYNKNFSKTKKKRSHGDEVTDFYNKEIPRVDSDYTYQR